MTSPLRPATPDDVAAFYAIEQQVSPHPWRESQFLDSLAEHNCRVLEEGNDVVGFVITSSVLDEVELLNIAVAPHWQGKGLGGRMLAGMIEDYRHHAVKIYLEVRVTNFAAIGLYRRHGFVQCGVRKGYYPTEFGREDAWLMVYEY